MERIHTLSVKNFQMWLEPERWGTLVVVNYAHVIDILSLWAKCSM
jgi:hypothetical protein